MDDKKLKNLFQSFNPDLSSDSLFLSKLKKNMEAVEWIKRHTELMRRSNRVAVCVAALTSFVMGAILSLLFPLIGDAVTSFDIAITNYGILDLKINWQTVGWLVSGAVCVVSAINAYEITLSKMTYKVVCSRAQTMA